MQARRVQKQPAFILQRRPYSENSLLLDAFTREHGRVAVLAKGARKLKSPQRGLLHSFTPLCIAWSGRRELVTLTNAESFRKPFALEGQALMCAWYASELITRFLHRNDPHEGLFDAYAELLERLEQEGRPEWSLRLFEKCLLSEAGYGLVLDLEVGGQVPIQSSSHYRYLPDRGPVLDQGDDFGGIAVSGRALLSLHQESYPGKAEQKEIKKLTRILLSIHLQGRDLKTRRVVRQLAAAW